MSGTRPGLRYNGLAVQSHALPQRPGFGCGILAAAHHRQSYRPSLPQPGLPYPQSPESAPDLCYLGCNIRKSHLAASHPWYRKYLRLRWLLPGLLLSAPHKSRWPYLRKAAQLFPYFPGRLWCRPPSSLRPRKCL